MDKSKERLLIVGILVIVAVIGVILLSTSPKPTAYQETFVLTENDVSLESVFWYAPEEDSTNNQGWAGMKIRVEGKVYPAHPKSSPETVVYNYDCYYYIDNEKMPYAAQFLPGTEPLYANDEYLRHLSGTAGVYDEKVGLADYTKNTDLKACCAVYEIQDTLAQSNSFYVRRRASNELCFSKILAAKSPPP